MNQIQTWASGHFLDQVQYQILPEPWKKTCRQEEELKVRSSPTDQAICSAADPEAARWIAARLNLASKLEQMTHDLAAGKTDEGKIVEFVKQAVM